MAKHPQPKYRPSLSADNIRQILLLAKTEQGGISQASLELIGILAPFLAKVENDAISVSHTVHPKPSMLELLGAEDPNSSVDTAPIQHSPEQAAKDYAATRSYDTDSGLVSSIQPHHYTSKEEYWYACYQKQLDTPEQCTIPEIKAALEHKYLAGLMTEAEAVEFEAGMM